MYFVNVISRQMTNKIIVPCIDAVSINKTLYKIMSVHISSNNRKADVNIVALVNRF